jgi:hypothetical protein
LAVGAGFKLDNHVAFTIGSFNHVDARINKALEFVALIE